MPSFSIILYWPSVLLTIAVSSGFTRRLYAGNGFGEQEKHNRVDLLLLCVQRPHPMDLFINQLRVAVIINAAHTVNTRIEGFGREKSNGRCTVCFDDRIFCVQF